MPSRRTHASIGAISGLGLAAYRAKDEQQPSRIIAESLGGAFGGYIGGILPDIIEPATWPGHRRFAHSLAAGGSVTGTTKIFLPNIEEYFRSKAEQYRVRGPQDAINQDTVIPSRVLESAMRFALGFVTGLVGGYVSHLALDAGTSKSIPIV